jgi:sugar phosphate isomerase/epimerase
MHDINNSLRGDKKMKLSCQEGLAPGASFAEKVANLEKFGFDGIELNGSFLNNGEAYAERRHVLKDSPVRASSICGGYPLELIHPDRHRRQNSVDSIKKFLDYAAELGARGPIVVPIFNHCERVPDLSPYKTRTQLEHELLAVVLKELADYAAFQNVTVLLEPLNRYEANCLAKQEDGARIIREINSPGVRLMSDVFHMNIEETSIPQTIRNCGDVIAHVHLADNTRMEPGSGSITFAPIIQALKEVGFDSYMAFECGLSGPGETVLPRSVHYLKQWM